MSGGRRSADLDWLPANYYGATRDPRLRKATAQRCLRLDGRGPPASVRFQSAIQALYSVAYTIRFDRERPGPKFRVAALEGFYRSSRGHRRAPAPGDPLAWTLAIPIPPTVGRRELRRAQRTLLARGKPAGFLKVDIGTVREGCCVEALHVGPYSAETSTVERMLDFARASRRRVRGPHHEIYLSDPRRVKPEKWRTILRYSLSPPSRPPKRTTPAKRTT